MTTDDQTTIRIPRYVPDPMTGDLILIGYVEVGFKKFLTDLMAAAKKCATVQQCND